MLLHQFFDACASASLQRVALDIPPGRGRPHRVRLTYAALAALVASASARLRRVVRGESLVALLLPRTVPEVYAFQLAALRAGAAYVSIDPSFPNDRIAAILADARPVALVTNAAGAERAARLGVAPGLVIDLDAAPLTDAAPESPLVPSWLTPSSLAYVIYTSGTTGRPRGVAVEHRAIANLVESDREAFGLSPGDRVGQGSSHAYDSSIEEIWLALSAGASIVVMDDDVVRSGPELVDWLDREGITVLCPPPTLLRSTGRRDAAGLLPRLTLLYVGGEALASDVVTAWGPGRRIVNGYGPTECAVTTIRGDVTPAGPIIIGRPIPGVEAWILDADLQIVPDGERGELCLGGVALARGYLGDPELTARKFIQHPELGRLYRTGDLAEKLSDGSFNCLGRIDTQIKLRGYRVELEELEAHLTQVPGVRAAACRVETHGSRQVLVAFLVAAAPAHRPAKEDVRLAMANVVPAALVPSLFVFVDTLPTSVSGKLDRSALPGEAVARPDPRGPDHAYGDALDRKVEAAFRAALHSSEPVGPDVDFFKDLGGDSLAAADLITALGDDPETAGVSARDLYGGPTVRQVAAVARAAAAVLSPSSARPRTGGGRPGLTTCLQAAVLLASVMLGSWVGYAVVFVVVPRLASVVSLNVLILTAPLVVVMALVCYAVLVAVLAVVSKRVLIGRYTPLRAPVWGGFYLRNWIVIRAVSLVPWWLLEGTALQHAMLRGLGARIGKRVHIHRGVGLLQGGWDLLDIEDDVSIGQDAALHLVNYDAGAIVVAPVVLARGATLEVRSGVGGGARVGRGACLTALSWLPEGAEIPAGERWDGVPAAPAGQVSIAPECSPTLSPAQGDRAVLASRLGLALLLALPLQLTALVLAVLQTATAGGVLDWIQSPNLGAAVGPVVVLGLVPLPCVLLLQALVARAIGPVPAGTISRWSGAYVRVWVKTRLVTSAGVWLSGTLFWPVWLRTAGMRVGRDCEISTIIDVVPEHLDIGGGSFLADGIYLGGPLVDRGSVTVLPTVIGKGVFVGNHAVIRAGQRIADGVLLGVSTVVDDARARPATAWFGHPAFELRRPPHGDADRHLTHEPSWVRYFNRVCWELLRFALPLMPLVVSLAWIGALAALAPRVSWSLLLLVVIPVATVAAGGAMVVAVLGLKWGLLGRVAPGQHPLWSCWCSRWDFVYVAWAQVALPVLRTLEGTLLLSWYLRAMGASIGKRVILGPGFAQVVDPDMIVIDDDATVQAQYQAHTFEDRILKIDRVRVGAGATIGQLALLMNGSEAGARTDVAPHSVVMKQTRLRAGVRYEGCPTHPCVEHASR